MECKGGGHSAAVSEDFLLDEEALFTSIVDFYNKWRGYGFIGLAQKDVVPEDRVFVHWSNLLSSDRFPTLIRGMEVQFCITKWRDRDSKSTTLRAKAVSAPGGNKISLQGKIDKHKDFVGSQDLRHTGILKFYNAAKGFGYVTRAPGSVVDQSVPAELRVERAEVNAGGEKSGQMEDVPVEFGIWKTKGGVHKVYNMTFPGGLPMTRAAMENRDHPSGNRFSGQVTICKRGQGWGFIELDKGQILDSAVREKLATQSVSLMQSRSRLHHCEAAQQRATSPGETPSAQDELIYFRKLDCRAGATIAKNSKVTFGLYVDSRGVCASDIECHSPAGSTVD